MKLHAWRIVKSKYAASAFSGQAAQKFGGRWNSAGTPMIYTAGSISLALLEILVHIEAHELLKRYVLFQVTFDQSLAATLDSDALPRNWKKSPVPAAVQQIGDLWATAAKSPILRIPSVIVPSESNYLLNPAHPRFNEIIIGPKQPIQFDPRLLKRRQLRE